MAKKIQSPLDEEDDDVMPPELRAEENYEFDEQPPSDIVSYNELRSCADLNRLYTSTQLEIQPDFQREVVWKKPGQTRFIDSLIKQLPIPSMCFSFDQRAPRPQWKVIDGLQRMSAITKFLGEDEWTLSRISDVDPRISGKSNRDFSDGQMLLLKERVENLTLPINVIRCDYSRAEHMDFLFAIFHRLNSGGARLNNQEIRNCIYSGKLNDLLKNLDVENPSWQNIKGAIVGSTSRFKSVELILRFFALEEMYTKYSGSLPRFLNKFMQGKQSIADAELNSKRQMFESACDLINDLILPNLSERKGFAYWEAMLVGVSKNKNSLETRSTADIKKSITKFNSISQLSPQALSADLSSTEKVKGRIEGAIAAFA
jgi:Protein of unknown function DUF262